MALGADGDIFNDIFPPGDEARIVCAVFRRRSWRYLCFSVRTADRGAGRQPDDRKQPKRNSSENEFCKRFLEACHLKFRLVAEARSGTTDQDRQLLVYALQHDLEIGFAA